MEALFFENGGHMYGDIRNPGWTVTFHPVLNIRKLFIELTNRCNLDCVMCYRHSWRCSEGEMDEDLFEKILLEISRLTELEEIVLGGFGEPLFHPKFWDWLSRLHAAAPDVPITLPTNGVLLQPSQIGALAESGVSKIVVSVDGADIDIQRDVRGFEAGEVSLKLAALSAAIKRTPGISWWWETVWQQKNKRCLPDVLRLAAKLHVKQLIVSHLVAVLPAQTDEALFDPEMAAEDKKILERARLTAMNSGLSAQFPREKPKTERKCSFVEKMSVVIRWDGAVAPCYRYLHGCMEHFFGRSKEVPAFMFGSLKDSGLEEIWTRQEYQQFRYRVANNLYPSCADCELVEGCDLTVHRAEGDCDGGMPSCGDCLWSRGMVLCP
ncbi:MAG: radical SAM protein [Firmicutes bacterium]|nr:radical SAM protein [Bacillota bacterium]